MLVFFSSVFMTFWYSLFVPVKVSTVSLFVVLLKAVSLFSMTTKIFYLSLLFYSLSMCLSMLFFVFIVLTVANNISLVCEILRHYFFNIAFVTVFSFPLWLWNLHVCYVFMRIFYSLFFFFLNFPSLSLHYPPFMFSTSVCGILT